MATLSAIGLAVVLFASTNVDDLFVLLLLLTDRRFRTRHVVGGQFFGQSALVSASLIASALSLVLRPEVAGLLGVIPIALGLGRLRAALRDEEVEAEVRRSGAGPTMVVAIVTIANGADNIGAYTPVFAVAPGWSVGVICFTFAGMTALWILIGVKLVNYRQIGAPIRRYGGRLMPVVLVGIGVAVLWKAGTLWFLVAWV